MTTSPTQHGVIARHAKQQKNVPHAISADSQGSSSSQDLNTIKFLESKSNSLAVHERVGKVEKRVVCMRQPFASEAVAFNSARMLRGMKILVHPEKCGSCKLWHLSHDNGGPDQP
jgi:hypothetical protein